jgi:hypothetical protein
VEHMKKLDKDLLLLPSKGANIPQDQVEACQQVLQQLWQSLRSDANPHGQAEHIIRSGILTRLVDGIGVERVGGLSRSSQNMIQEESCMAIMQCADEVKLKVNPNSNSSSQEYLEYGTWCINMCWCLCVCVACEGDSSGASFGSQRSGGIVRDYHEL